MLQNYDWLKIYDANNKKIGEYATDELPPTDWKEIESNALILWLKTDNSTAKGGFKMEWKFVGDGDDNSVQTTTDSKIPVKGMHAFFAVAIAPIRLLYN